MTSHRRGAARERGAALVFALILVAVLAVVGVAVIRYTARDRIDSARMVVKERALTCAEAGLQYGRRFFGGNYLTTDNWTEFLSGARPGRLDRSLATPDDPPADADDLPLELRGDGDGDGVLDEGANFDDDPDGEPDFWVSIRDDDDERDLGLADNRLRNNNLSVILRSECTNPIFASEVAGQRTASVLEVLLTFVQGRGEYGTAADAANSMSAGQGGSAADGG